MLYILHTYIYIYLYIYLIPRMATTKSNKAAVENYSVEKVEMKDASALVTVSEVRTRNQQVLEGSAVGSSVSDEEWDGNLGAPAVVNGNRREEFVSELKSDQTLNSESLG